MLRNHQQCSSCKSLLDCTLIFTLIFLYFISIFQETNLHIELRHYYIGILTKSPDEDRLEQRVMDVLAEWDQLLLNDFSGGGWATTSPELYDFSLVYVSKTKFHGERYVSVHNSGNIITSFFPLIYTEMRMSADGGMNIIYGLKVPFDDRLRSPPNRYY